MFLGSLLHFGAKQCVKCYLFPSPCLSCSQDVWYIQLHFILVELCYSCLVELVHVLMNGLCAVFSHAGTMLLSLHCRVFDCYGFVVLIIPDLCSRAREW